MKPLKRTVACFIVVCLAFVLGCAPAAPAQSNVPAPAQSSASAPAQSRAPAQGGAAAPAHEPVELEIYSNTSGAFGYVMAMAWAELINEQSSWVKAVAVESQGGTVNELMMYDNPDRRANTVYFGTAFMSYKGTGDFAGKQSTRHRTLLNVGVTANVIVSTDPGIATFQDMIDQNKPMLLRTPKGMALNPYMQALISAVTTGEMAYEYMDMTSGVEAMLSNRGGGYFGTVLPMSSDLKKWTTQPATEELFSRADHIQFVDLPLAVDQELQGTAGGPFENFTTFCATVPANMIHPAQTAPLTINVAGTHFFADESMDEELVYEIVRIFGENTGEFVNYHPQAEALSVEMMATYTFPGADGFHPGATRYYEEKGIERQHIYDWFTSRMQ